MPQLSKDDRRAVEAATTGISAVRAAQAVAVVLALVRLWHGEYKGALILGAVALLLSLALPRVDPGLLKRLRDTDKP